MVIVGFFVIITIIFLQTKRRKTRPFDFQPKQMRWSGPSPCLGLGPRIEDRGSRRAAPCRSLGARCEGQAREGSETWTRVRQRPNGCAAAARQSRCSSQAMRAEAEEDGQSGTTDRSFPRFWLFLSFFLKLLSCPGLSRTSPSAGPCGLAVIVGDVCVCVCAAHA